MPSVQALEADPLPLRLAQALVPQSGNSRQPAWSTPRDGGLGLQPAGRLDMPGAAGIGLPEPLQPGRDPVPIPGPLPAPIPGPIPRPIPTPETEDAPPGALERMPAPSGMGPSAVAGGEPAQDGERLSWTIPPIRWGGSLGYGLRRSSSSDGSSSLDQVLNANVRGSSYIYAPWLATVSGSLGFVSGVNDYSGNGSQTEQTRNASLVGNANLDLFPSSRFPFGANVSRSDSRVASTALAGNYTETRLGLRQSYRSEDSLQYLSAGLDHSLISTQSGGNDTVSALYGNYSAPIGPVGNSLNGRVSVSQREGTGEGSRLLALNSSHFYNAHENLSLQAYSNFTDNDLRYRMGADGLVSNIRGQYLQAGTSVTWRPELEDEEDYPLSINGGLNYIGLKTDAGGMASQSQRVTGNTSAYYRFSPNLSVNASGMMNYFSSNAGQSQLISLLSGAVSYSGDPLTIGNFSYNWNTGGNASWQSPSGETPSNILTAVQAGHSLGRHFGLSGTDSIVLTLSQNVSAYQNQQFGNASTLSNSAMTSYRLGLGERFNGTLTGTFSDILSTGVTNQHYKNMNLGMNGYGQLSPRSSASVNLNLNWSDQTVNNAYASVGQQGNSQQNGTQQNSAQRMSVMGNASYTHMRFANIPGLRYTFLFTADSLLRDDRLLGDANARAQRSRYSVDNRLDYRIGMLDLRLSAMVNEMGGKKNALLFFQVTRQIGAY